MQASPSPAPKDIIWKNVGVLTSYTRRATAGTSIVWNAGLLFWGVVLAFVASISSLSNLETFLPFLTMLDPVSYSILEGQLPVVVLIVFMILLPMAMTFSSQSVERRKTVSGVQQEVFKWFFKYQLANVYLILLAGSIFNALSSAISNPPSIIGLIGKALPQVAVFFINFFITTLLTGVPSLMLRLVPVLIFRAYRLFFKEKALTRRTFVAGPLADFQIDYGTTLPAFIYTLLVTQLYWVISPILLIVTTLFFAASYVVWKYQYLYVVVRSYESGGNFFYGLYYYSMVGLMSGIVTLIVFMGIKQGTALTILLLPLALVAISCWRYTEDEFKVISMNLPYSAAASADFTTGDERLPLCKQPGSQARAIDGFTAEFNKQPNLTDKKRAYPYPYRVADTPLFTASGELAEVYHSEELPPGVDAEAIAHSYVENQNRSADTEVPEEVV